MIFRSPFSDNTKPLESSGFFVISMRRHLGAVAQWLLEASRTNKATSTSVPATDVPWVQHGQLVFVDYAGTDAITIPVGLAKGIIPPAAYDTFFTAKTGAIVPFLASDTELNFTGPTKGWYIAKEAANGST